MDMEKNMNEHTLWVEKYRPNNLETYIGNEQLKDKVKHYLDSGDLPHLLLFGKAGTGKTTLAKLLVNNIDCDYLYINASDENNVETVRTKVKNFASTIGFKDMKIIINKRIPRIKFAIGPAKTILAFCKELLLKNKLNSS